MLVSVIIPTFNCGRYIREAIDSVLIQTYPDREIIVIDDGSTDETSRIAGSYGDKIRYLYQRNQGSSKARNAGLQFATGECIAFLDADDRWKPYKLELQMRILESLPGIDMLFTNYSTIDENGGLMNDNCVERGFPIFSDYGLTMKSLFNMSIEGAGILFSNDFPLNDGKVYYGNVFDKLFMGNFILPSTEIFKRRNNAPLPLFNEQYQCAVDQDYHLRFSRQAIIAYVDCSTVDYRLNRVNQLSGKKNTTSLILNTIDSRLQAMMSDHAFMANNKKMISKVLGNNYARLAYYYLSELNKSEARKYARGSFRWDTIQGKAWFVYLCSFAPASVIKLMRNAKLYIKKIISGWKIR